MLYMYDDRPAGILKRKYTLDMCKHQNACESYIWKPQIHLGKTPKNASYYVAQAFSFDTWSSLYFAYKGDFSSDLMKLYKIYQEDNIFQMLLEKDCNTFGKELTENQIFFFLEEHLMMYFIAKRKVELKNEYVPHHDRVLISYPGKPPRHLVYMMQKNFFNLTDEHNIYAQNRYDLTEKKLYDFTKIDLDSYEL